MFLKDIWYFGMAGEALRRGAMIRRILLGEPILFGRDATTGEPFALRDICPHRGVPLSAGHLYDAQTSGCGARGSFRQAAICSSLASGLAARPEVSAVWITFSPSTKSLSFCDKPSYAA